MIIFRYLARQIFSYSVGITLVLMVVFISNRLIYFLQTVAAGKIAPSALVYLVLFQIPHILGAFLPGGVFFGILLAYGRLYLNSEMTVLFACGISRMYLLKVALFVAFLMSILVGLIMFWISPMADKELNHLVANKVLSSVLMNLLPGQFQNMPGENATFFVKSVSRGKQMQDVFVVRPAEKKNPQWTVLSAPSGAQQKSEAGDTYLVAKEGYQYQLTPGSAAVNMVKFHEQGFRVSAPPEYVTSISDRDDLTLHQLIATLLHRTPSSSGPTITVSYLSAIAELGWRLSMPISTIVLALLAVPLSRANPRHGKFTYIIPGLLLYIIYANMLFVVDNVIESGGFSDFGMSPWTGVWILHVLMLLVVGAFWIQTSPFLPWRKRAR